jgi:hypothetical protein
MADSVFNDVDVCVHNFPSGIFAVRNAFAKKKKEGRNI